MSAKNGFLTGASSKRTVHLLSKEKIQIMRLQLNNQDLIKKVTMYLDNELSEIDERDLLHEIKSNPDYLKLLSQEKSFREFIKSKIHRRKPSPALIQSIKEKIKVDPARP